MLSIVVFLTVSCFFSFPVRNKQNRGKTLNSVNDSSAT